jgi:uracil-DNA glycosylase
MMIDLTAKIQLAYSQLCADSNLNSYVNTSLRIPSVFRSNGDIRLFFLGQDPTVKNAAVRKNITCTLNLNHKGGLLVYLAKICQYLGLDLKTHVYATNLVKNFFTDPPTQIREINVLEKSLPYWLPVLELELSEFPSVPVITLGEPILSVLVKHPSKTKLRDYWGYTPEWKQGVFKGFSFIPAEDNILERVIFPFPHQPTLRKGFYKDRLFSYCHFMKTTWDDQRLL